MMDGIAQVLAMIRDALLIIILAALIFAGGSLLSALRSADEGGGGSWELPPEPSVSECVGEVPCE